MIKFMKLENNIAYRYGVVDFIPQDIEKAKNEFKVDRFITEGDYKMLSDERKGVVFEFLF